eukprot:TRINITY_DN17015_c1_g1_i1.p1 TRINITY_DN17015_c1_g1~~TRINITY_DN17015_c1_g1_i1.p1  ORF type:complete len:366 (+),score=183.96 TRINITY_DN17015_c1_g1_i1:51-1100(+)
MAEPTIDPAPVEVPIAPAMSEPKKVDAPAAGTLAAAPAAAAAPINMGNLQKAKEFLGNPQVRPTALARKVNFLKSKGMSVQEIHRAFEEVGQKKTMAEIENAANNVSVNPPAQPQAVNPPVAQQQQLLRPAPQQAPQPEGLTWKDYFIGATLFAGSLFGVKTVASQYLDIDVKWKDERRKKKPDTNRELPAVPAASSQKVNEIEAKVAQLEEGIKEVNGTITSLKGNEEKLGELVKSSESMLKKNAENNSKMALLEGKVRMQERIGERVGKLETSRNSLEELTSNLKISVEGLAKRVESKPAEEEQQEDSAEKAAEEGATEKSKAAGEPDAAPAADSEKPAVNGTAESS